MISFAKIRVPRIRLPKIRVESRKEFYGCHTSPGDTVESKIYWRDVQVGKASFGISPLSDRVYLYDIRIDKTYRRKGLGLAFLTFLRKQYSGQPITPVHELGGAKEFWDAARAYSGQSLDVTSGIGTTEMIKVERRRWIHLWPIAAEIDRVIEERFSNGEPFNRANSRGIDA